ncbi:uncharacterized protein LOC117293232 [Asterias rubens]|uniref:uncharacterized protein LOC117293232 n=1 Tax=Asterias rubens TaxID=7604 RepID=UPI00145583C2|nr:uncharacterized protein LOC117293232 [Asterias rubens]
MHAVMSGIQLVCVLLFLGALLAPSVIADEHDREVRSFEDKIKALTDTINTDFANRKWDEQLDMWLPDAYLSVEGFPLAHGKEAIRKVEKTAVSSLYSMTTEYIEVGPQEEGADYVYVLYTEKWHDQNEQLIQEDKCLLIWRNTDQGYKVAMLMVNSNV